MSNLFSDIQVRAISNENSKVVGVGSVLVADRVQVNFVISESRNGPFVKFPQHKGKTKNKETGAIEDKWFSDVFFKQEEDYREIQTLVLDAFNAAKNSQTSAGESNQASDDKNPF